MLQRPYWTVIFLAIILLCTACSEDSTSPEDGFALVIDVVDGNGNPIADLDMAIVSDNRFMQDGLKLAQSGGDKAATKIQYFLPSAGHMTLAVYDVAGAIIRTLVSQAVPAGGAAVMWDGLDDEGVHQASGRYTVRLTLNDDSGNLIDEKETDILMALLYDHIVGTTDAAGRVILRDKRLFPHFYNQEPITALDEQAIPMGLIEFDGTMRFYFTETTMKQTRFVRVMVSSPGQIKIVWDSTSVAKITTTDSGPTIGKAPLVPTEGLALVAYPNPFN